MADKDFLVKNGISVNATFIYTGGLLTIGNSSINTTANSTKISITGDGAQANMSSAGFITGISSINSTAISVGSNAILGAVNITFGNTTVNSTVNSTALLIGSTSVNASVILLGNSTVNVVINSNSLMIGNSTVNSTSMTVGNSTVYTTITPGGVKNSSQTLTYAAPTAWNVALGKIASVTLTGNNAFGAPTNLEVGYYALHIYQDATGNRSPNTWSNVFCWPANIPPTLSTTARAHDLVTGISDGTYIYCTYVNDVRNA